MEKIAVMLGASSGIGYAAYKKIKKEYPNLRIIIIDKQELDLLSEEDLFYKINLSDFDAGQQFIKNKFEDSECPISFLINTVGFQENVSLEEITSEQWDSMYNLTVKSIFFIEREVIKQMKKYPIENQSIVNITSIHAEIIRDIIHYSSSKASLKMVTKELAYKLASNNIRVNSIEPGSIDTPLLRKELNTKELLEEAALQIPMKRHGFPEEVADLILFLISDKAKYITGTNIIIDGGLSLII